MDRQPPGSTLSHSFEIGVHAVTPIIVKTKYAIEILEISAQTPNCQNRVAGATRLRKKANESRENPISNVMNRTCWSVLVQSTKYIFRFASGVERVFCA